MLMRSAPCHSEIAWPLASLRHSRHGPSDGSDQKLRGEWSRHGLLIAERRSAVHSLCISERASHEAMHMFGVEVSYGCRSASCLAPHLWRQAVGEMYRRAPPCMTGPHQGPRLTTESLPDRTVFPSPSASKRLHTLRSLLPASLTCHWDATVDNLSPH
jgi:hypothetical protein